MACRKDVWGKDCRWDENLRQRLSVRRSHSLDLWENSPQRWGYSLWASDSATAAVSLAVSGGIQARDEWNRRRRDWPRSAWHMRSSEEISSSKFGCANVCIKGDWVAWLITGPWMHDGKVYRFRYSSTDFAVFWHKKCCHRRKQLKWKTQTAKVKGRVSRGWPLQGNKLREQARICLLIPNA